MALRQFFTYFLWLLPALLQAGIVVRIVQKKLYREFPCFLSYTAFEVVKVAILLPIYVFSGPPYLAYFVGHWAGEAVDVALGLAVIYEIYAHVFAHYPALQKLGRVLFQWCGALLCLLGVIMAASASGSDSDRLIAGLLLVEQCFSIVRVGLLLFLFVFAGVFGLTWRHYVFGIATGLALFVSIDLASAAIRGHLGSVASSTYVIVKSAAYNCSVLVWVSYFFRQEPRPAALRFLPKNEISKWNEALLELMNR